VIGCSSQTRPNRFLGLFFLYLQLISKISTE
jgi:hypothetical protein